MCCSLVSFLLCEEAEERSSATPDIFIVDCSFWLIKRAEGGDRHHTRRCLVLESLEEGQVM
jgi:hypothetical protein